MDTEMVPRYICASEGSPGAYRHDKGARTHLSNEIEHWHIWALGGCPAHMSTRMVPGQILAHQWWMGTHRHRKGSQANMGTKVVP